MSRAPLNPYEFITPYNAATPPKSVICIDERYALNPDGTPHKTYIQTGGGAYGVAQDWMVGAAIDVGIRHGEGAMRSVIGSYQPVHRVAGKAAQVLRPFGIELKTHEACAIELLAEDAASTIANATDAEKDGLFRRAQYMDPEVRRRDLVIGARAMGYMAKQGLYAEHHHARKELAEGVKSNQVRLDPVERVEVNGRKHVAEQIIINSNAGTVFDTRAAWEAGMPAYHIGLGATEQHVRQNLAGYRAVSYRGYRAATVLRHSGVLPMLPPGPNGEKPVDHLRFFS